MPAYYRFYCLNRDDRVIAADESHCNSDDAARVHALDIAARRGCRRIEVWNRDRLVGQVDPQEGRSGA